MRKGGILLAIFIFLFSAHLNIKAQEAPAATGVDAERLVKENSAQGEQTRISLSLRNIDIIDALKFFVMKSGLNIVPTQSVAGRVTLAVENVPIKDVFDIMLRSNSLAYDKIGNIYNVMSEAEYKKLYGRNFGDTRMVKVFRLKYAIPEQAFSLLDAVKSDIGRLLVDAESGAVMIIDTPDKIKEAQNALAAMEQKSTLKVFDLQYANAKDVEEQLKAQLNLKKVGSVRADERTNQVIVQTLPERMKDIEALIASLDKKTKAVLIDTKIIKIAISNELSSGIEWEGLFKLAKTLGMTYMGSYPFSYMMPGGSTEFLSRSQVLDSLSGDIGSYPFSGTASYLDKGTTVIPGEKLHVGVVNKRADFDVVLKYLQTLGKTKIISNPSLAVINNQEAKIHIGERRAYVTTTTTTGTTTKTVSEEVTYVDTGVRLSLIPTINDDGYVTIKVKPEISSVIGQVTSSSGNVIPVIDTSTAETTVIAKDGATILLAGLGREEKTESTKQVPILSKIPILGFLFRSSTKGTTRTELVIMLTPIITEGDTLVTPKDKEKELYGPKPMKKFDVFRPEVPAPAAPGEIAPLQPGFMIKDLKSYSKSKAEEKDIVVKRVPIEPFPLKTEEGPEKTEDIQPGIIAQPPSSSSSFEQKEGWLMFKGMRNYN